MARNRDSRHAVEPHSEGLSSRLNWLRAAVLGANDGIVSVAGIVLGVAGATTARGPIFTAGLAGLVAGAVSMALGEYVAVESARQREVAARPGNGESCGRCRPRSWTNWRRYTRPRAALRRPPRKSAAELTAHDAMAAHVDAELRLDPDDLANPLQAAAAPAASFTVGAPVPLPAIFVATRNVSASPSPSSLC